MRKTPLVLPVVIGAVLAVLALASPGYCTAPLIDLTTPMAEAQGQIVGALTQAAPVIMTILGLVTGVGVVVMVLQRLTKGT